MQKYIVEGVAAALAIANVNAADEAPTPGFNYKIPGKDHDAGFGRNSHRRT